MIKASSDGIKLNEPEYAVRKGIVKPDLERLKPLLNLLISGYLPALRRVLDMFTLLNSLYLLTLSERSKI